VLAQAESASIDLSGRWAFALDRADVGIQERWQGKALDASIKLPGSLQEQGFGDEISMDTPWTLLWPAGKRDQSWHTSDRYAPYRKPGNVKSPYWLTPERHYVGVAWYQRELNIPAEWKGRRVVLFLERPHWGTTVWVDDREVGTREGLGVPHEYDLGTVAPGPHRLAIRVDNRLLAEVGLHAHCVSDFTQGNWNGVVGRMELRSTPTTWIEDVQVFPDAAAKRARIKVSAGNAAAPAGRGELQWSVLSRGGDEKLLASGAQSVDVSESGAEAAFEISLPKAELWSEFTPVLYTLQVSLKPGSSEESRFSTVFGLRDISTKGTQLTLNGTPIFLRGTHEGCVFPLTGYPPTDEASWKRVFETARAHGLNHMRFHSWCPPEAAFAVADEMGFYLQAEAVWSHELNLGKKIDTWLPQELERMVRAYGNHPSFMILVPSNEPGGRASNKYLGQIVNAWKAKDPRRLYSAGTGWPSIPENQFHVTGNGRAYPRRFWSKTDGDCSGTRDEFTVPVVQHEIGQYCAFPNLEEIPKYKGSLKAGNFEIVRDFLEQGGMLGQARDFLMASGKLQTLFYKEEIEAQLRTSRWGGFQLLDLHDFPGQGTALVGVLDAFWDSKGYVTPEEFRRFCSPTVPLTRFEKRLFLQDETLVVPIEVAHYGPRGLQGAVVVWRIRTPEGREIASGRFAPVDLPVAEVTKVGKVEWPLKEAPAPSMLNLEVSVAGTSAANDWNIWIYPVSKVAQTPAGIHITTRFDGPARAALAAGGSVLLLPEGGALAGNTRNNFNPIFWNSNCFPKGGNHTLGILCDPRHPALAQFPTSFHSDWQWQDPVTRSRPMVLDALPRELKPIVQVIDDWNQCRKLGMIFEAKVGAGRLLVCSVDLKRDDGLAIRQLKRSLFTYMASPEFKPAVKITEDQVEGLFAKGVEKKVDRK
jgi:hypothetical protein